MASADSGRAAVAAGTALADSDTAVVDSDMAAVDFDSAAAGSGTAAADFGMGADSGLCSAWPGAGHSEIGPLPRDDWGRAGRKLQPRAEKGMSRETGPQRRLPPHALFPRWNSCSQVDLRMGSKWAPSWLRAGTSRRVAPGKRPKFEKVILRSGGRSALPSDPAPARSNPAFAGHAQQPPEKTTEGSASRR